MPFSTLRRAALLLSLCAAVPAAAQSLGVGVGSISAPYPTALASATFDSDIYVAGFYGRGTYLQAFTGTDQQPGITGDSASVRLFGADLFTGGNPTLVRIPGDLPVTVFVPVRLGASYRYVDAEFESGVGSRSSNLGEGTLGVGGGIGLDAPPALTSGFGRVSAEASYVVSAGALADFSESEPEPLAVRAGTLSLGVRVTNILGSRLGASLGYTHRGSSLSGALNSFGDFIEAVTSSEGLSGYETLNLVRVGLAF